MLQMNNQNILHQFIEKELILSAPDINEATRTRLMKIALGFLKNQISMIAALTIFSECSCPHTVITKLAQIKAIGDQPNSTYLCPKPASQCFPTRKKSLSWRDEEDARLIQAVAKYGNKDWVMISAYVGGGRTSSQCNQRWTRALDPSISKHPWTKEEDNKLVEIVNEMGEYGWRKIAKRLEGRTDLQCRHRYLQLKRNMESNTDNKDNTCLCKGAANKAKSKVVLPSLTNTTDTFHGLGPLNLQTVTTDSYVPFSNTPLSQSFLFQNILLKKKI